MIDKKLPGQPRDGGPAAADPAEQSGAKTSEAAGHTHSSRPAGVSAEDASTGRKRPPNVKDHIGRQLRALYDEVASQPVPDRFMELLDRLDVKRGDE